MKNDGAECPGRKKNNTTDTVYINPKKKKKVSESYIIKESSLNKTN